MVLRCGAQCCLLGDSIWDLYSDDSFLTNPAIWRAENLYSLLPKISKWFFDGFWSKWVAEMSEPESEQNCNRIKTEKKRNFWRFWLTGTE